MRGRLRARRRASRAAWRSKWCACGSIATRPKASRRAARAARYAVYAARPEPIVALAHHLDDQAETLLLQLLRGTGLKGVAAMPEIRALPGSSVRLFRPLLGVARERLREYALARRLAWVEDESNASLAMDRNYLRHEIAPRLDARFAGWREAAARFARHAADADDLLDELARVDGVRAASRARACASMPRCPRRAAPTRCAPSSPRRASRCPAPRASPRWRASSTTRAPTHACASTTTAPRSCAIAAWCMSPADCTSTSVRGAEPWCVPWRGEGDVDLGPGRGR